MFNQKEYVKKWQKEHSEHLKNYRKKYYEQHKDYYREYSRTHYTKKWFMEKEKDLWASSGLAYITEWEKIRNSPK